VRIRIVAEASTRVQKLFYGWGLSFLIDGDLLFDTFSNETVLRNNMEKMGIDAKKMKYVVISHEHWDHTGGLRYMLERNKNVQVFICPGFSDEFKRQIESYGVKIMEIGQITEIKENIYTTGQITGEYDGKPIYEQSLIIGNGKISVVTGCSHPGVVEIIKKAKDGFAKPVHMVLGGFHLLHKTPFEIARIIREFRILGVEKTAPCHCTGRQAVELFRREYRDNFIQVKTGMEISI